MPSTGSTKADIAAASHGGPGHLGFIAGALSDRLFANREIGRRGTRTIAVFE